MGICVVSIEGVLALGTDLKTAQPTKWARALYDSLHHEFRMIAFTANDQELAQWWLKRERLHDWAAVMTQPDHMVDFNTWKQLQVNDFLAEGWEMGLLIDTDLDTVTKIAIMGVPTMLLCHPVRKVGWKDPEDAPRPWVDVVDTL